MSDSAKFAIELSDDEFAALTKSARSVQSPYLADVKSATVGKGYGINIPSDRTGRSVVNNIIKAAKELDVRVQVIVREKAVPPMVVFKVLGSNETVAPAVTAPVPAVSANPSPAVAVQAKK